MYLNTVFKYNIFKYCPALLIDVGAHNAAEDDSEKGVI